MEDSSLQYPERTKHHPAEKVCLLLRQLLVAYFFLLLLFFQHGRNQVVFPVVGYTILEGGAPYKGV